MIASLHAKITPFLWFDNNAEEAIEFYTSIFKNSRIVNIARYGEAGPGPKGTVMVATFELDGQGFMALNGGPEFSFSPAISFLVNCDTQDEVDEYREKQIYTEKLCQTKNLNITNLLQVYIKLIEKRFNRCIIFDAYLESREELAA